MFLGDVSFFVQKIRISVFSSILRIYKIEDILPGDCVRKVLIDGAWDMRLIGKVAEPGALNGLHAELAGAGEFM